MTIANLADAVQAGNEPQVRLLLNARPELIHTDMSGNDEHRVLHYAVLNRNASMVKLLMEAGADPRKGIYPHREATSALTIAKDRDYHDIVEIIEQEERLRREELSCPNATISPLQDQIHQAITNGDNAEAIRLLESDASLIQACDRNGRTPLHIAAQETNEDLVAWLLHRRANVRKQDVRGFTPLDCAALPADPEKFPATAKLLLDHGAEVTSRAAVALADEPIIHKLVSQNPALLSEIDWRTGGLLTLAVKHSHTEIVRLLLDLGADVDERVMLTELEEPTLSWGTPLWHAALAGHIEIAKLLLDRGADPNANVYASGWPLRNAWDHEDDSVKRLLLERGAKPQPYMLAEAHDVEAARHLLANDPSEALASELAWSAADHGCAAILELALPHLNWRRDDPRWHWILIQPIRGVGSLRCMLALLKHGVDPNVSRFGATVLHFAAGWHGSVSGPERARFASMLLDHGARLDLRDDLLKSTPLGWAYRWGRKELVELLIARGAPMHEPDAEPWATPKAWAEKGRRT